MSGFFSDRHFDPRKPVGNVVPSGVRAAVLTHIDDQGINATVLWRELKLYEGYSTPGDLTEDAEARYGAGSADDYKEMIARWRPPSVLAAGWDPIAEPSLRTIPVALFFDAVELGLVLVLKSGYGSLKTLADSCNSLFARRAVPYRINLDALEVAWVGDPGVYEAAVIPALTSLSDPRLEGARGEFQHALAHLRAGGTKDLEDAVEESAKAVESVLKVVTTEHSLSPRPPTAQKLWQSLVDAGIAPSYAENSVTGAARVRNEMGAHGAGAQPRIVPRELAELSVASAAAAIPFLTSFLP